MVKLIFCLTRRPELSHAEFIDYWYQKHAPLLRKHAEAIGILKYVQSHTLEHPVNELLRRSRSAADGYDGVAEIYYQSAEALHRAMFDPTAQSAGKALLEDEKRFIDLARSALFVCSEQTIIAGPSVHPDATIDVDGLPGNV
ncbi:MAG: EthD domain-containing protein [Steroidobacteraceae bacterium]